MFDTLQSIQILQRLPQLGPSTYWRLIDALQTPQAVLACPARDLSGLIKSATRDALADWQRAPHQHPLTRQLEHDQQWLSQQTDCHVIASDDPHYPQLLLEISRPPPLLYVKGDPACLNLPQLAVVGSRNATAGGLDNAHHFSRHLAAGGLVITSGLAAGIDASAHQGALAGKGLTGDT